MVEEFFLMTLFDDNKGVINKSFPQSGRVGCSAEGFGLKLLHV